MVQNLALEMGILMAQKMVLLMELLRAQQLDRMTDSQLAVH